MLLPVIPRSYITENFFLVKILDGLFYFSGFYVAGYETQSTTSSLDCLNLIVQNIASKRTRAENEFPRT